MALTKQAFTPSNGFKDTSAYPNPTTGAINRAQRMLPHEQMQTYVNDVLTVELDTALGLKADDSAVVHDTGNETVAGIKTFSSSPIVPNGTTAQTATTQGQLDTHKTSSDHDGRYYTETEIDSKLQGVVVGQIPANSLTETSMANDMKKQAGGVAKYDDVGDKSGLNTVDKSSIVNSVNEVNNNQLTISLIYG